MVSVPTDLVLVGKCSGEDMLTSGRAGRVLASTLLECYLRNSIYVSLMLPRTLIGLYSCMTNRTPNHL